MVLIMKRLLISFLLILFSSQICFGAISEGTNAGFVSSAPVDDPVGGSSDLGIDTFARACKFTSPVGSNTLTSIGWWSSRATEEADFQVGIYSHDADNNLPNVLLASSGDIAKGTSGGWIKATVNYSLTTSTVYWLAVQCDDTATTTNIDRTDTAGYKAERKNTQTSLPALWGTSQSTGEILLAIYGLTQIVVAGVTDTQVIMIN